MDAEIIKANRRYLQAIARWIREEDYLNSRSRYGCPPRIYPLLDLPIDETPTYTDLIVAAARRMSRPVQYLELGVSVGKNFYVLANALEGAILWGIDWERINPVLAQRFTPQPSAPPLLRFTYRGNDIVYVEGDIRDEAVWARTAGRKFDIVFSDACHDSDALLHEYAMLRRFDLLNADRFCMVWDDLDGTEEGVLTSAFMEICEDIKHRFDVPPDGMFRVALNGWLGQHEHRHTVGVINNIGITAAFCGPERTRE